MTAFRPATDSDAASLAALVTELGYPATVEEMRGRLRLLPDSYGTILAEVDGRAAGFVGMCLLHAYEHSIPIGYILALSILPDHRRQGIGRNLVLEAEKWFHARGVSDIRLASGLQRTEAHVFYERCGFVKTGYRFRKLLENRSS